MVSETDKIKKLLKDGKAVIGADRVKKMLRQNKLDRVYLAANAGEEAAESIMHYAKLLNIPVVRLEQPNDELGVVCKKQYSISVLGSLR